VEAISVGVRFALAVVFLSAAGAKVRDLRRFEQALGRFPLIGGGSWLLGKVIALGEGTIGLLLATGMLWREAGLAAAALLLFLTAGYIAATRNGREMEGCGCGGVIPDRMPHNLHACFNGLLIACALGLAALNETAMAIPISGSLQWSNDPPSARSVFSLLFLLLVATTLIAFRSVWQVRQTRLRQVEPGSPSTEQPAQV
jgi:uncharacterized membrane protein YphA (DoxX/SURF4 family)